MQFGIDGGEPGNNFKISHFFSFLYGSNDNDCLYILHIYDKWECPYYSHRVGNYAKDTQDHRRIHRKYISFLFHLPKCIVLAILANSGYIKFLQAQFITEITEPYLVIAEDAIPLLMALDFIMKAK